MTLNSSQQLIEQVNALTAQLAFERAQVATLEASEAEAARLIEEWMALEAKAQARVEELVAGRDNLSRALWVALGGSRSAADGITVGIDGQEPADAIKISRQSEDHTVYCRKPPVPVS